MTESKTLIESLDDFAIELLKQAKGVNLDAEDDRTTPLDPIPLAEKTRAFDAVVKWVGERNKIMPEKPKEESKIAGLKDRLNGGSARDRTSPRKGEKVDVEGSPSVQ